VTKNSHELTRLKSAAERMIQFGHSIMDCHEEITERLEKLERDKARVIDQVGILAQFLLTNFPGDISAKDLACGEGVIEVTVRLLVELKKRRLLMPPSENGRPTGPRPPITPSKPQRDK